MTDAYHQQLIAQRDAARAALKAAEDELAWHRGRAESRAALDQLLTATEAERDGAYQERARLLAWLAAIHVAVIADAPDIDEDGWQILYLHHTDGPPLTWHIHPRDADLFSHVEHVEAGDLRAWWDGHTTEEKYWRITQHIATLARRCGPECSEGHTYTGRCEATLTAVHMTAPVPACPECPRQRHPGYTCQEAAAERKALERAFTEAWNRGQPTHLGAAFVDPSEAGHIVDILAQHEAALDKAAAHLFAQRMKFGTAPLTKVCSRSYGAADVAPCHLPFGHDGWHENDTDHTWPTPVAAGDRDHEAAECGHVNSYGSRPCIKPDQHDGWHENKDQYSWDSGD